MLWETYFEDSNAQPSSPCILPRSILPSCSSHAKEKGKEVEGFVDVDIMGAGPRRSNDRDKRFVSLSSRFTLPRSPVRLRRKRTRVECGSANQGSKNREIFGQDTTGRVRGGEITGKMNVAESGGRRMGESLQEGAGEDIDELVPFVNGRLMHRIIPWLSLRPYQLVGVNWLLMARSLSVNAVLADEMGLGKTIQSIAFMAALRERETGLIVRGGKENKTENAKEGDTGRERKRSPEISENEIHDSSSEMSIDILSGEGLGKEGWGSLSGQNEGSERERRESSGQTQGENQVGNKTKVERAERRDTGTKEWKHSKRAIIDIDFSETKEASETSENEDTDVEEDNAVPTEEEVQREVLWGPHLIIVPVSVIRNWEREVSKWLPSLRVVVYHGSAKERAQIRADLNGFSEPLPVGIASDKIGIAHEGGKRKRRRWRRRRAVDIVITTYSYFSMERAKNDRAFLRSLPSQGRDKDEWPPSTSISPSLSLRHRKAWDVLILDEAHCLRNSENQRFKRLSSLQAHTMILLSGTPVQNDAGELLSLMRFCQPRVFGGFGPRDTEQEQSRNKSLSLSRSARMARERRKGKKGSDMKRREHALRELFAAAEKAADDDENEEEADGEGRSRFNMDARALVRSLVQPFILRRRKRDVLSQLPPKSDLVAFLPALKRKIGQGEIRNVDDEDERVKQDEGRAEKQCKNDEGTGMIRKVQRLEGANKAKRMNGEERPTNGGKETESEEDEITRVDRSVVKGEGVNKSVEENLVIVGAPGIMQDDWKLFDPWQDALYGALQQCYRSFQRNRNKRSKQEIKGESKENKRDKKKRKKAKKEKKKKEKKRDRERKENWENERNHSRDGEKERRFSDLFDLTGLSEEDEEDDASDKVVERSNKMSTRRELCQGGKGNGGVDDSKANENEGNISHYFAPHSSTISPSALAAYSSSSRATSSSSLSSTPSSSDICSSSSSSRQFSQKRHAVDEREKLQETKTACTVENATARKHALLKERALNGAASAMRPHCEVDEKAGGFGQNPTGAFHVLRKCANHPLLLRTIFVGERFERTAKMLLQCGAFSFEGVDFSKSGVSHNANGTRKARRQANPMLERVREELRGYSDFRIDALCREISGYGWEIEIYDTGKREAQHEENTLAETGDGHKADTDGVADRAKATNAGNGKEGGSERRGTEAQKGQVQRIRKGNKNDVVINLSDTTDEEDEEKGVHVFEVVDSDSDTDRNYAKEAGGQQVSMLLAFIALLSIILFALSFILFFIFLPFLLLASPGVLFPSLLCFSGSCLGLSFPHFNPCAAEPFLLYLVHHHHQSHLRESVQTPS